MAAAARKPPRRSSLLVLAALLVFGGCGRPVAAQQAVAGAAAEAASLDVQPQSLRTPRAQQHQQAAPLGQAVGAEQQLPAGGDQPADRAGVEQLLSQLLQQQQAQVQAQPQQPQRVAPQQVQQPAQARLQAQQPQPAPQRQLELQPQQAAPRPQQQQAQQQPRAAAMAAESSAAAELVSEEAELFAYGQEHAECPSPQPPTSVPDVYLAHGTFVWSDLAAGDKRAARRQQQQRVASAWRSKVREALRNGRSARKAAAVAPKPQPQPASPPPQAAADPPPAVDADPTEAAAEAAAMAALAEAMGQVQPAAAAATAAAAFDGNRGGRGAVAAVDAAAEPAAAVSPAAVTDLDFLLSVGPRESGRGFAGTYDTEWRPSDEALAVAPHPTDADLHTVLHGVNNAFEVFFATKDGRRSRGTGLTQVYADQIMAATLPGLDLSNVSPGDPSAWWDAGARRWFIVWSSFPINANEPLPGGVAAGPLWVCVSTGADPLGRWNVWVLDSLPALGPGLGSFCAYYPGTVALADYPQVSYSAAGVFVSVGVYCLTQDYESAVGFMPALYAYGKSSLTRALPRDPRANPRVLAATYTGPGPWTASVPPAQRAAVSDDYKPFFNFIKPVWPQAPEDVARAPLFVMKIDDSRISVATLLDDAALELMSSTATAPPLLAVVVDKGANFANTPGQPQGDSVLHQPDTSVTLAAGDVGSWFAAQRSYSSVQHAGVLYTTMLEFWGAGDVRLPSIYWGVFDVSRHLCRVSRRDWGVVASAQGLGLSYPVIGARGDGSALLAYVYSGAGNLPNGLGPAFAGVATSVVGGPAKPTIDVVKRGTDPVIMGDEPVARWGDYSAAAFVCGARGDMDMWFAVPWASMAPGPSDKPFTWQSWISSQRLRTAGS